MRCHIGKHHQGVIDVAPWLAARCVVDDDVVVNEQGIEAEFLRPARRFHDGFGGGREAEVVRVGKPEGVVDHIASESAPLTEV